MFYSRTLALLTFFLSRFCGWGLKKMGKSAMLCAFVLFLYLFLGIFYLFFKKCKINLLIKLVYANFVL